ncbi:MAG: N-acetylmuramoyl-L-alanine amidase [Oscillospiraceae bacterium]
MKRFLKGMTGAVLALGILTASVFAEPAVTAEASPADTAVAEEALTEEFTAADLISGESMVYLQSGMRAVTITPTVDFYTGEQTDASLAEELPALFTELSGYDMNAVVINTDCDDVKCYDLDMGSGRGALGAAIDSAHENGFCAYVQLDVNSLINDVIADGGGLKSGFSAAAHKFVMKYACEGILLTNYYTSDSPEMYAEYMRSGSGIGYENWLYETNEYIIRTLSEVIRRTSNTTAVGLLITDMWANYTANEDGSVTADTVQALYDGFCDTRQYLRSGYADFIMVKAYGTDSDTALNFDSVISWWYSLAEETGVKLYTLHLNERIGQYSGWYEDQLLRQLSILEDYPDNGGSCFNSLAGLRSNLLGSTDTLLKYFDEQINTDTLFDTLQMTSPTQTNFVTYDSTVKFMGTFDENFDVLFDGKKVTLNEAGNFYFQKELKVGRNTFVIEHKGKKITYVIDRQVDVLRSIEQTKDIVVEGGSRVTLEAIAYSGSKVSAVIGGQTVNLKEKSGADEDLDANSDYARFVGHYRVPEGMIGQEQYLGSVSYYAVYKGIEEYMTGGGITIAAEPEPPKEVEVESFVDESSVGTGEIVGTIAPVVTSAEYITYIKTLNNHTTVYDSQTTGSAPCPVLSQLPAGTLDYYKSASGDYVISTSGRRYLASDVTTFYDTGLGENKLYVKAVGNYGGKSYLKIHLDYKSAFNVTTPISYVEQDDGPYGVTSYAPDRVEIVFDNVTSVTKLPDFDSCSLFSAGSWDTVEQNGVPKFRLTLTLRQAGIYSGCGAYYDENGDLILTFDVPTASLSGKVIVIDPGHGYGKYANKLDPGGIGNVTEQSVNLAVSKVLEQKLTDMGATVVRLKTESEFILTATRPTVARAYGADMFISLHCNSVLNEQAHGVEVYYFTPFSQPLAKSINDNLSAYYDNTVYADGTNSNRGDKYSYYWVTLQQDFPSVLVEMGFISNERECMVMADPAHQAGIAQSIAEGVKSYFARSALSYSGSGSSEAPYNSGGENTEPTQPESPDTPDTPDTPENPVTPEEPDTPDTPATAEVPDIPEIPETEEVTAEPPSPATNEPNPPESEEAPPEISVEVPDEPGGGGIRVE